MSEPTLCCRVRGGYCDRCDLLVGLGGLHVIGVDYERNESRVTERNGSRPRLLTTHAGNVQLTIPKLRAGSFFPSILSPRRRMIDQALHAVVMEASVHDRP